MPTFAPKFRCSALQPSGAVDGGLACVRKKAESVERIPTARNTPILLDAIMLERQTAIRASRPDVPNAESGKIKKSAQERTEIKVKDSAGNNSLFSIKDPK
mmetsp:Transcript_20474/g.28584  ORF Transcript_20474/g.28584 Transcript_20474/m.28584 type:complete len:101 (-) Transcript_20474:50-352(-)